MALLMRKLVARFFLWQIERPHQEHRHLGARDRVLGAVVATAATGGDALYG